MNKKRTTVKPVFVYVLYIVAISQFCLTQKARK